MPSYFQTGRFNGVSYITGPSHVCLHVAFTHELVPEPEMIAFPARDPCCHGPLDLECIRSAVVDAIAQANDELGTAFSAAAIGYIPNDSPRYELFGYCVYLLVKRMASGEPFPMVAPNQTCADE